jgi:hypothetical protein
VVVQSSWGERPAPASFANEKELLENIFKYVTSSALSSRILDGNRKAKYTPAHHQFFKVPLRKMDAFELAQASGLNNFQG